MIGFTDMGGRLRSFCKQGMVDNFDTWLIDAYSCVIKNSDKLKNTSSSISSISNYAKLYEKTWISLNHQTTEFKIEEEERQDPWIKSWFAWLDSFNVFSTLNKWVRWVQVNGTA